MQLPARTALSNCGTSCQASASPLWILRMTKWYESLLTSTTFLYRCDELCVGLQEVTSVAFSKNQRYLLSAGRNNAVVLWDLSAKRPLLYYNGHRHARHRSQACFSHNEDFVITSDDASGELVFWNSRTGELAQRISAGHNAPIRWVAHSPVAAHLVSCR